MQVSAAHVALDGVNYKGQTVRMIDRRQISSHDSQDLPVTLTYSKTVNARLGSF